MTAFRRKDRPSEGYRIEPTLPPPWGRVGPWQTGLRSKRQADAVEAWLRQIALERPEIIDALVEGRFGRKGLQTVWIAKLRGKLDDLMLGISDPLLSAAAAEMAETTEDARAAQGMRELAALADEVEARRAAMERRPAPKKGTIRLSWLTTPRNVSDLYQAAEVGRAPNSVRRSHHRAVSELLAAHYGKARTSDLMLEVKKPSADDNRKVSVTAEEIAAVLAECDIEFVDLPALAMLLAVDRSPLLRIRPRFFDEEAGTLGVLDRKTDKRPRTIELSTPAWAILRRRCTLVHRDAAIFQFTPSQVRHRWEAARDRAAGVTSRNKRERGANDPVRLQAEEMLREEGVVTLPLLRFKDLRHLLPTAWNALGFSEADLQEIIGHAHGSQQTRRYITARVAGDRDRMDRVAAYLGLDRFHLRAAGE